MYIIYQNVPCVILDSISYVDSRTSSKIKNLKILYKSEKTVLKQINSSCWYRSALLWEDIEFLNEQNTNKR